MRGYESPGSKHEYLPRTRGLSLGAKQHLDIGTRWAEIRNLYQTYGLDRETVSSPVTRQDTIGNTVTRSYPVGEVQVR